MTHPECDHGGYYEFYFPGDGSHHVGNYIPECTKPATQRVEFEGMPPLYRCDQHKAPNPEIIKDFKSQHTI